MAKNLRVISFNCQSFNRKTNIIESLLNSCDVLCLQETLLNDDNYSNLENLDNNFLTFHVPAIRNVETFTGRSSGGLAVLWRKSDNMKCVPYIFSNRIMGIKIELNNIVYLLLNIYCFCDYGNLESLLQYKSLLADLSNICTSESFNEIIITGDMNADPTKGRFFKEYSIFVETHSFFMSDIINLPTTSYSYISSNTTCSTSWLDHVITSKADLTVNHKILYGCTFYDHVPIYFDVKFPYNIEYVESDSYSGTLMQSFVSWDKVTEEDIIIYNSCLDSYALHISDEVLACNKINCCSQTHRRALEVMFGDIIECISVASDSLPSHKKYDKKHRVIGWNRFCKDLYILTREKYLRWHNNGRIRHGIMFEEMKSARYNFKKALKYCRDNEMKIRKDNLLSKFNRGNKVEFWKEIRKIKGNCLSNTSYIDGKSNFKEIVSIFDMKYNSILNDASCQTNGIRFSSSENWQYNETVPLITLNGINDSVFNLNVGMGWDRIHSNHLKYSGPVFRNFLCKLFNKFLSHQFVPRQMLGGQIRPILKNNCGSKTDSSNYRPVMNSSSLLKIFEYCLKPFLSKHLNLDSRQFGFRNNTSCPSVVSILKETVMGYSDENSNVHCVMVDLSKAFDKINYDILMLKLRKTSLPKQIVNILDYMCNNTYVNVLFNGITCDPWKVGNGARQGGILSPLIFNFYLNDAIRNISYMNAGCFLGGIKTNIICYADDIALLAPSASGLQKMLDKMYLELDYLGLTINVSKCAYLVFKKAKNAPYIGSTLILNGEDVARVQKWKYLGIILSEDLSNSKDIDRAMYAFLRQFNSMYSKFYYLDRHVLFFIFKAYTSSFYGTETWFDASNKDIHKISVTYHKAVKRCAGLNIWDSNHEACEIIKVYIFNHLLAKRLVCFLHSMISSSSPCLLPYRYYIRYDSGLYAFVSKLFFDKYNIDNIFANPLCAVLSRIGFVQRNEPRRR